MIKILIGGSPCTYWSVAQKKGREVEAEGLGWELFRNYLIAKEKFKPDFFLYENNKSAAQPIKDQISHELGVDLMHINSALVSAQNRQRFYAFNWNVDQPADRGIMLKDILETATSEKGYELRAPAVGVGCRNRREDDGKLYRRFERTAEQKAEAPESPDQTTDLSDAPEEIKEQIIENDRALKEKDSTAPAPPPEGFNVVDQLSELLAERKKLHIIDEENLRYNCDIIALEYAIGALRR